MNYFYNNTIKKVHHKSLPNNFRMLIVGQSGCGKTTLLMRLLLEEGLLNYTNLYIFSKSIYQPEYQCLIHGFSNKLSKSTVLAMLNAGDEIEGVDQTIEELAQHYSQIFPPGNNEPKINIEYYDSAIDVPDPTELITRNSAGSQSETIKKRNLMVFDDIMTDKLQTTPENYYTRGRTCNCDSIYLTQNYIHLPLHTI